MQIARKSGWAIKFANQKFANQKFANQKFANQKFANQKFANSRKTRNLLLLDSRN